MNAGQLCELFAIARVRNQEAFIAARLCWACEKPLRGRQVKWCSKDCSELGAREHFWTWASRRAILAADRCAQCGKTEEEARRWDRGRRWLEVNHIIPLRAWGVKHAISGCWHHEDNLEVLCHDCHGKVTRLQIVSARAHGGSRTIACWGGDHESCWTEGARAAGAPLWFACCCSCHGAHAADRLVDSRRAWVAPMAPKVAREFVSELRNRYETRGWCWDCAAPHGEGDACVPFVLDVGTPVRQDHVQEAMV